MGNNEADKQETPLERCLEKFGRNLIIVVGVLSAVMVTAGVLRVRICYRLDVGISLAIAAVLEGVRTVRIVKSSYGCCPVCSQLLTLF